MPAFVGNTGTPGPVTNTIWFGSLIDRLNCLTPNVTTSKGSHGGIFNLPTGATSIVQCDYGNLWTPNNATLGATTAAPDGTTANSQLLVEDTSNNQHFLSSTTLTQFGSTSYPPMRLVGIFKYNGRRVVLQASFGFFGDASTQNTLLYTVFDLAGGQIGVSPTLTTTFSPCAGTVTALGAAIVPLGNGWYKCSMDFIASSVINGTPTCQIYLDNGTGTGALSNSYTGNGTSGVYVWRTNLMPIGAYGLNNVTFFDDFTDITKSIDLNNTGAPGFSFYINQQFPCPTNAASPVTPKLYWGNAQPIPGAGTFTQQPSAVRIQAQTGSNSLNGISLATTGYAGTPGSHVGTAFEPPFFMEIRFSYALCASQQIHGFGAGFLQCQDYIDSSATHNTADPFAAGAVNYQLNFDYLEAGDHTTVPLTRGSFVNPLNWPPGQFFTGPATFLDSAGTARGTRPYYSAQEYHVNEIVGVSGTNYVSNTNVAAGDSPPGAHWNTNNYPASSFTPNFPNNAPWDYTQMHTYGFLYLPYHGAYPNDLSTNQMGSVWQFFDGLVCCTNPLAIMAPQFANNMLTKENLSYAWFQSNSFLANSCPQEIDFFRVTQ